MSRNLLIRGGRIIDPVEQKDYVADVLIREGRIDRIGENLTEYAMGSFCEACESEPTRILDAKGMLVFPGLVDVHSHFRDPGFTYKEDIETGAKAAMAGGYTTIVLMANTKPTVDTPETLEYVKKKAKEQPIHLYTCANVSMGMKGTELVNFDKLFSMGAVGFTDDGIPMMDEALLREAMQKCAKLHCPISLHEEDPRLITNNGVNRGKVSEELGIGGSPREAEITMIARDLPIAIETGAILDIQHISTKEGVALVREAKKQSSNIHAEACPHHFALNEDAVLIHGTLAKMNPPLRTEEDRLAIIEGLLDGTIDLIATDHAPHAKEEKAKAITEAPSGILGLETALALANEILVKEHGMSYVTLAERICLAPARMYGMKQYGSIREGGIADLCIFDPEKQWVPKNFQSKSVNSPFLGRTMTGRVMTTICDGEVVYEASLQE